MCAVLILDLVVVAILKSMFRRKRPGNNRMDMFATVSVDVYSFPSGHATRAAMVTCFLVRKVIAAPLVKIVVAIICLYVGLSRVMLGRHHIMDVIFGLVIGWLQYHLYLNLWIPFNTIKMYLSDVLLHLHL